MAQERTPLRVAAIDCGTHSIRLLISELSWEGGEARGAGRALAAALPPAETASSQISPAEGASKGSTYPGILMRDIHREMRIVGLGEGVDQSGRLSPAALQRCFEAVADYATLISQNRVRAVRMIATSASRDADNFAEFSEGVEQRLGVKPQVITGHEEAELGFLGTIATHEELRHNSLGETGSATGNSAVGNKAAQPDSTAGSTTGNAADSTADSVSEKTALVVDIGGGSTEFASGSVTGQLRAAISTDMGSTRVTERFLRPAEDSAGVPSEAAIGHAQDFVDALIAQASAQVPLDCEVLIGVAGSVTTLTAVALGLDVYDPTRINGAILDSSQLRELAGRLIRLPHQDKRNLGPMHPKRVTQIAGGVLVWERILAELESRRGGSFPVMTSESDILDGVALRLAHQL